MTDYSKIKNIESLNLQLMSALDELRIHNMTNEDESPRVDLIVLIGKISRELNGLYKLNKKLIQEHSDLIQEHNDLMDDFNNLSRKYFRQDSDTEGLPPFQIIEGGRTDHG